MHHKRKQWTHKLLLWLPRCEQQHSNHAWIAICSRMCALNPRFESAHFIQLEDRNMRFEQAKIICVCVSVRTWISRIFFRNSIYFEAFRAFSIIVSLTRNIHPLFLCFYFWKMINVLLSNIFFGLSAPLAITFGCMCHVQCWNIPNFIMKKKGKRKYNPCISMYLPFMYACKNAADPMIEFAENKENHLIYLWFIRNKMRR